MKLLVILTVLSFICMPARSQATGSRNVHKVIVTSSYIIEDGERTNKTHTLHQEIFDSLGRLHTEVDFNPETRYPDNYRWHYYDNMLLVGSDFFIDEKLDRRIVFKYGKDSLVNRELHYRVMNKDTILFKTLEYSYDSDGMPKRIDALNKSGKRLYRVRSTFDDHGTEIKRRVRTRRGEPSDGIIRIDRDMEYDNSGLMVYEKVSTRKIDRSRSEYQKKYRYNERQMTAEIIKLDDEGNQLKRVEYFYQDTHDRIAYVKTYDEDDNLTKWHLKRYEIYKDGNRRQRIIEY